VKFGLFWKGLGWLKKTKRIGRIALYTLNKENPIANKLDELSREIAIYTGKKLVEKETIKKETPIPT